MRGGKQRWMVLRDRAGNSGFALGRRGLHWKREGANNSMASLF